MSQYDIRVSVSSEGGSGGRRGPRSGSAGMEKIREEARRSRLMSKEKQPGGVSQTPQQVHIRLTRTMVMLNQNIVRLTRELQRSRTGVGAGAAGGGFAGAGLGGYRRGGAIGHMRQGMSQFRGGNIGRGVGMMGAGLGLGFGALLGALGFIVSQVTKVGRAYGSTVMQQAGTEGVAGFQFGGRGPVSHAQLGQYQAAKFKAAGQRGGAAPAKYGGSILQYGFRMGISQQELGQQVGMIGRFSTGGDPEAAYGGILARASQQGRNLEIPQMMQAISSALADAVKEGVNDSDLASDMAKEIGLFSATRAGPANRLAGISIARTTGQQRAGIQRGEVTTVGQRMRMEAAQQMMRNPDVMQSLVDQGVISAKSANFAGTNPYANMSNADMRAAVQHLMRTRSADVEQAYIRKTMRVVGVDKNTDLATAFNRIVQFEQNVNPNRSRAEIMQQYRKTLYQDRGMGLTDKQRAANQTAFTRQTGFGRTRTLKFGEASDLSVPFDKTRGYNMSEGVGAAEQQKTNFLIEHGAAAYRATVQLDQAMMRLAATAGKPANTAITGLGRAIDRLSKKAASAITVIDNLDITEMVKKKIKTAGKKLSELPGDVKRMPGEMKKSIKQTLELQKLIDAGYVNPFTGKLTAKGKSAGIKLR